MDAGQAHLFEGWSAAGEDADEKAKFFDQIALLESSYPGGIKAYVESGKALLAASSRGENSLEGWTPEVPEGESLEFGSQEWLEAEALGAKEAKKCGFVLVAGGLGERLGYSRIKIELPTETATLKPYLEYYAETILAIEKKTKAKKPLPLAIMVSGDTEEMTREMLAKHKDFGMKPWQITLIKQEKVAALADNEARIAREGTYGVQSKPHGHGDVHVLLHSSGLVKKWAESGTEWVYFFQDTNALGFRPLYATLGVSKKLGLHCNFLTVPRFPGQAVGGVAKLTNDKGETMVINVEYNQLDPLLRNTVSPEGDVAGEDGVHSPYPGNINQFLLACKPYAETLERTKGVMGEFVNPKYADSSKTTFKKPARLECMMQDYPKVLGPEEKVGFTSVANWIAFSPCKNATADAVTKTPPACALTAEADQYFHCAEMLRHCGCTVDKSETKETWDGISSDILSPSIVLSPLLAPSYTDLKKKFPAPSFVSISSSSTLILSGDVTVRSLKLDGGLVVNATKGAKVTVAEAVVKNEGFKRVKAAEDAAESFQIRGYTTEKPESVEEFNLKGPGLFLITTDPSTNKLKVTKKTDCPVS